MKNRRLYAMFLLVALALLQARAAFAGCLDPERATSQAASGCCFEHALPEGTLPALDQTGMVCAQHCLQSSNSADATDVRLLVGSEPILPFSSPPLRSAFYPPLSASLGLAGSEIARPSPTDLLYILQRLLI